MLDAGCGLHPHQSLIIAKPIILAQVSLRKPLLAPAVFTCKNHRALAVGTLGFATSKEAEFAKVMPARHNVPEVNSAAGRQGQTLY